MTPRRRRPGRGASAPVSARSKLLTRPQAEEALARARRRGERVVFTNGCFDLLHLGHVRFLEGARSLGDRLIVALNSDASVRRLKGPARPLVPARQRAEVVAALSCVDWVVVFGDDTPRALIAALRPDLLVKGAEWKPSQIAGAREVRSWGGQVVRLPQIRGVRTSRILERARRGRPAPLSGASTRAPRGSAPRGC